MFKEYPHWGYHADKAPLLIMTEAHHAKLGEGYYESPSALAGEKVVTEPVHEVQPELGPEPEAPAVYDATITQDDCVNLDVPEPVKRKPGRPPKAKEAAE